MTRIWIAMLGVTFAAALADADPPQVELQSQVYVSGPTVSLGDIATVSGPEAGSLQSIEIAPAATPGATRRFSAAIVMNRIARAGVPHTDVQLTGASQVNATTLHLDVTPDQIASDLHEFIQQRMPWDPDNAVVDVFPPSSTIYVADGDMTLLWRANPQYDFLGTGTFRGEIMVDGRLEKSFYAKARIEAYEPVVVAAGDISRGDRLTDANVRVEKRGLSKLRTGAFFAPEELRGLVARSSIYRGQVITDRKVEAPEIVKRNQVVTIETRIGRLSVQGQAKALDSASAGEYLSCESLSSEEKLGGVLRADGVVVVE